MDLLGDAAASTLGYITGNLPGAYVAHRMYRRYR